MQPRTAALDGCANCLFVYQMDSAIGCLMMNLPLPVLVRLWLISHSTWSRASDIRDDNIHIYMIKIDLEGSCPGAPETKVLLPR